MGEGDAVGFTIDDLGFMIEGSFLDWEKYQDKQITPIANTKKRTAKNFHFDRGF